MSEIIRMKYLKIALFAVGVIFIFAIYPLTIFWPSGWSWNLGQSEYLQMILGIYFTFSKIPHYCFKICVKKLLAFK